MNIVHVHVDEVRLCLWTAAINGPTVHPPYDEYGEPRWKYTDRGNPKNSDKNLSQIHFVHHKSQMDCAVREPEATRWKASD
jgi:hypothetical protein